MSDEESKEKDREEEIRFIQEQEYLKELHQQKINEMMVRQGISYIDCGDRG